MNTSWQPISTAPKDGRAFFVSDALGLVAVCCLDVRPRKIKKRRGIWPWSKDREEVIEEGGAYIFYALPMRGAYGMLNMRPDFGFEPKWWTPLDALPEPPA